MLDGKKVARVEVERLAEIDLIDLAMNVRTDFSKAPAALRESATNLLSLKTKRPTDFEVYVEFTPLILKALNM